MISLFTARVKFIPITIVVIPYLYHYAVFLDEVTVTLLACLLFPLESSLLQQQMPATETILTFIESFILAGICFSKLLKPELPLQKHSVKNPSTSLSKTALHCVL